MTDPTEDEEPAPIAPFPGGDVGILVIALVLTTILAAGSIVAVYVVVPDNERATVTTIIGGFFVPTLATLAGLLKSHSNGIRLNEVKQKVDTAAVKAEAAATKAETAVRVAADAREELRQNTDLTVQTFEGVKKVVGAIKPKGKL